MKKLNVNYMYLEITRRCTLECAHCMRGNRQNIDMSEEILDNALKDVSHVHELDLGYEIKTCYQKDENIKRHILLKKI